MPKRGRPAGPDMDKIRRIINVLLNNPEGIWIRGLAKQTKLPLSTVHYYLENHLNDFITNIGAQDEEGKYFGVRLVKLKKGVKSHMENGTSLKKLMKTRQILTDIK